jgi:hypothetical protein
VESSKTQEGFKVPYRGLPFKPPPLKVSKGYERIIDQLMMQKRNWLVKVKELGE